VSSNPSDIENLVNRRYQHGFVTDIESDSLPPGLDEDVIRALSAKKAEPEFMLAWRYLGVEQS
jgi:Fe-S cluster assembly protein SufB